MAEGMRVHSINTMKQPAQKISEEFNYTKSRYNMIQYLNIMLDTKPENM